MSCGNAKLTLYTTTNIDVLLFIHMLLEHIGRSLQSISFVFLTRSEKSTNRRFIKTHALTNRNIRPALFLQPLSCENLLLSLLSNSNRSSSSELRCRNPITSSNLSFGHAIFSMHIDNVEKTPVTSIFRSS